MSKDVVVIRKGEAKIPVLKIRKLRRELLAESNARLLEKISQDELVRKQAIDREIKEGTAKKIHEYNQKLLQKSQQLHQKNLEITELRRRYLNQCELRQLAQQEAAELRVKLQSLQKDSQS